MTPISTIVITFNEEGNIRRCLESVVPISAEIIVVDSGSTDRTVPIAKEFTANVVHQDWLGYGRQKQFALSLAAHQHVLSIDADEEVSAGLQQEIAGLDWQKDGYYAPRRVHYLDRWLQRCWYPGYVLRLFRKGTAQFTDEILHESVIAPVKTGRLREALLHYSYRDVSHHLEKMNDFTTLAARQMHAAGRKPYPHQILIQPGLEFFKMYVLQRGFLDGFPGLVVSGLTATYVLQKYAKLYELWMTRGRSHE
jgi:glycosyltransferase involved in cell wall biosynthesis